MLMTSVKEEDKQEEGMKKRGKGRKNVGKKRRKREEGRVVRAEVGGEVLGGQE
jgi:hypothetical protein